MLSSYRCVKASRAASKKFTELYGSSFLAGRVRYRIVYAMDIQTDEGPAMGLCDPEDKRIFINISKPDEVLATLIHEAMHAEFSETGMRQMPSWSLDLEELCCEVASRVITNFELRKRSARRR